MLYLIDLLNIIDIFLAFIILDRLSLKDKKISIGVIMTLLIVTNLQRRLVFPVVVDLFFIVLLVSLSYMNRREQPIGITLLHLVCSFGVFQLNNFLLYPRDVLLFIGLKANEWQIILYVLFTVGIGVAMSLLLRKYVMPRVNQFWKQRVGYLLFVVLLLDKFVDLMRYTSIIPQETERKVLIELIVSLSVLLIGIFALSILIFSNNQKLAFETKEKEIEQRAMQLYIHEISKQNQAIRQFKHDYINILSSLEGYIELGDLAEMKAYYEETIQPTGQLLDSENARLADLRKIEPLGLRSLLTIKLLFAQEKGIEVHLEIEEIDWQIKVNEIDLIRVVGILLDNAIEELENLGQGRLDVALFSKENESRLLIRNTVRTTIEPLHQLKSPGFSTKGEGRGLGLATVETLVNQSSFFFLETKIDSNYFLQNLTIAGGSDA